MATKTGQGGLIENVLKILKKKGFEILNRNFTYHFRKYFLMFKTSYLDVSNFNFFYFVYSLQKILTKYQFYFKIIRRFKNGVVLESRVKLEFFVRNK